MMKSAVPSQSLDELLQSAMQRALHVDLTPFQSHIDPARWTLAADALRLLAAMVRVLRPNHVLELGSGISTRVLLRSAQAFDLPMALSSIDHDPEYGPEAARAAAGDVGRCRFSSQIASLVVRSFAGEPLSCYHIDPSRLASVDPVDLALIDGPPNPLGGRAATLLQLMPFVRPGAVVLLDDAVRADEQEALRMWEDWLGSSIEVRELDGFSKGLAVIQINQPVLPDRLWAHRQELAMNDIRAAVPPTEPLVLLDGERWDRSLLNDHRLLPLVQVEGGDQGAPADDAQALRAIAGLPKRGVRYLAMGWPAAWWRRIYPAFCRHLKHSARCICRRQRVTIFELQP